MCDTCKKREMTVINRIVNGTIGGILLILGLIVATLFIKGGGVIDIGKMYKDHAQERRLKELRDGINFGPILVPNHSYDIPPPPSETPKEVPPPAT